MLKAHNNEENFKRRKEKKQVRAVGGIASLVKCVTILAVPHIRTTSNTI